MSGWIKREEIFPEYPTILCYGKGEIFIADLMKFKDELYYSSRDWGHNEYQNQPEWTHWVPFPEFPEEK